MLKELLGMNEGILQDLYEDHRKVAGMIDTLLETEDGGERSRLFKEMMTELTVHLDAEQRVLYRKMEKSAEEKTRKFAFEGTNEHQIAEMQLQQMAKARNKAGEQWTAQLTVLRELVNHHVEEEESTGWSCARKEFDREELDKMREQFRRQKEKLMTEA